MYAVNRGRVLLLPDNWQYHPPSVYPHFVRYDHAQRPILVVFDDWAATHTFECSPLYWNVAQNCWQAL